jgi:hypothetical protein
MALAWWPEAADGLTALVSLSLRLAGLKNLDGFGW